VKALLGGFLDPKRGSLQGSLEELRRRLGDPHTAHSIPNAVATLVEQRVRAVQLDLAKALDLADPASGRAKHAANSSKQPETRA